MARSLRVQFPGAIYHVTSRMVGHWRQEHNRLFEDAADYQRFLDRLAERVKQFQIRLYLYCLMANHYHLVFETPAGNGAAFLQSLATAYTVYFNLRHQRHGHLLDGRYKAKVVEGDRYLLRLSRYVHLNPVFVAGWAKRSLAERIEHLRAYRWSSYRSYIGAGPRLDFLETGPILAQQGGRVKERAQHYREYVERGLANGDSEFVEALEASPRSLGSEQFRAWVDGLYQKLLKKRARLEDVSFRRVTEPVPASEVLETLAETFEVQADAFRERRRDSVLRAVAADFLLRYAGQNQRQAAETLGMGTGSAVSWQLRQWSERLAANRQLRRLVARAEQYLEQRAKGITISKSTKKSKLLS